jgi:hypothetical protein
MSLHQTRLKKRRFASANGTTNGAVIKAADTKCMEEAVYDE